jgi:glycosyltransferase involved in cell wall biosynthesis
MIKVIVIAPLNAVGGINSWYRNMEKNFREKDIQLFYVDNRAKTHQVTETNQFKRFWFRSTQKIYDLIKIVSEVNSIIKKEKIQLIHATTSGSAGSVRDLFVAKICKWRGVKTIMQCRYGNIPQIIERNSYYTKFLIYVMKQFDVIWVLDSKSHKSLSKKKQLKDCVEIVPNPINTKHSIESYPSSFSKIAFVASVIPSKGILDLVNAIVLSKSRIELTIVGNGSEETLNKIRAIASQKEGGWLNITGPLANNKARQIIQSSDILALPTYYAPEAFPISILEAMSYGKLVISTSRAAISDILKYPDGSSCGIIIPEQNPKKLQEAIDFCVTNPNEAINICIKGFQKVKMYYSNEVVFKLYSEKYNLLLAKN